MSGSPTPAELQEMRAEAENCRAGPEPGPCRSCRNTLRLIDALGTARALLSAWRYAKAFAGAEAWDGGHDMKQRFDLVDSVTASAGIEASETFDEFRAHLGGQAREEEEK